MLDWVLDNIGWVFSGVGTFFFVTVLPWVFYKYVVWLRRWWSYRHIKHLPPGLWTLSWTHGNAKPASEKVRISRDGNYYWKGRDLIYLLRSVKYDKREQTLTFVKAYPDGQVRQREILTRDKDEDGNWVGYKEGNKEHKLWYKRRDH